jgi:hypothetical protein
MNVSLEEHRLGGLRWIVVRGPDREAFRTLGEHMRGEMAALTQTWPLLPRLREHVSSPPGSDRLNAVRQASVRYHPEAWAELAAFAEGAAMPLDDLALLNFRGDPWPRPATERPGISWPEGCSDRPAPSTRPSTTCGRTRRPAGSPTRSATRRGAS